MALSDATHEDKEKTLQKGESMMQNKEQQRKGEYYKTSVETIKDYDEILLFGPTDDGDFALKLKRKFIGSQRLD